MSKNIILALLFFSQSILADEVLLAKGFPDKVSAFKVVKAVFIGRKWNIVEESSGHIIGELNRRNAEAKLLVTYREGGLFYSCECFQTKIKMLPTGKRERKRFPQNPKTWLENLTFDIQEILSNDVFFIKGLDNKAYAFNLLKSALLGRNWSIIEESDDRIIAGLNHRNVEAKLFLTYRNNKLYYSCESFETKIGKMARGRRGYDGCSYIPKRWLNNLAFDINNKLAMPKHGLANKSDFKGRLKFIETLFKDGTLTAEEYAEKRKSIIDEL